MAADQAFREKMAKLHQNIAEHSLMIETLY
jgi:hypothetical protein